MHQLEAENEFLIQSPQKLKLLIKEKISTSLTKSERIENQSDFESCYDSENYFTPLEEDVLQHEVKYLVSRHIASYAVETKNHYSNRLKREFKNQEQDSEHQNLNNNREKDKAKYNSPDKLSSNKKFLRSKIDSKLNTASPYKNGSATSASALSGTRNGTGSAEKMKLKNAVNGIIGVNKLNGSPATRNETGSAEKLKLKTAVNGNTGVNRLMDPTKSPTKTKSITKESVNTIQTEYQAEVLPSNINNKLNEIDDTN